MCHHRDLVQITTAHKVAALGEIGPIPSVEMLSETRIPWAWYMTWSNDYGSTDLWTSEEELCQAYRSDYAVTLDKLPKLY